MSRTVMLVDDHELIRYGLRLAFERDGDFEVVAEAATVEESLSFAARHQPEVAVVDMRLPDGSGIDVLVGLRKISPDIGVVMITMYAGDEYLFAALDAGASAFVTKTAPSNEVVTAARHAVEAPHSFSTRDLAGAMQRRLAPAGPDLTERESKVLKLLADGLGVTAISRVLFVSDSTTKSHIARLYEKLGAANRAQAIMCAVRFGLLGREDTTFVSTDDKKSDPHAPALAPSSRLVAVGSSGQL